MLKMDEGLLTEISSLLMNQSLVHKISLLTQF